jgi:hypothetical protein
VSWQNAIIRPWWRGKSRTVIFNLILKNPFVPFMSNGFEKLAEINFNNRKSLTSLN